MAASGRGLCRAVSAWPWPVWRRAHCEATGRLKPEYDAVVIGAGKAAEPEPRAGGSSAQRPGRTPPQPSVCWAQAGQEWGQKGAGAVVEASLPAGVGACLWFGADSCPLGLGLPGYNDED